jgi:hypothetical protein
MLGLLISTTGMLGFLTLISTTGMLGLLLLLRARWAF